MLDSTMLVTAARSSSTFHLAMGTRKKAMKDLTKALKINEFYTMAREARAFSSLVCCGHLLASKMMKQHSMGSLSE